MTLDHTDVGAWFFFTPADNAATDPAYPTEEQCDAMIAAGTNDFQALAYPVVFSESDARHITILKWLVERQIKAWFKVRANMGESYTISGGSVSHQFQPILYSSEEIRKMIAEVKDGAQGAAIRIHEPDVYNERSTQWW